MKIVPGMAMLGWLLTACIPDPVTPNWYEQFVATADTSSSYPAGSSILRCYWEDQWVYLIENPLNSCVACEVLTEAGDTLFFTTTAEQLAYIQDRRRCTEIWRKD